MRAESLGLLRLRDVVHRKKHVSKERCSRVLVRVVGVIGAMRRCATLPASNSSTAHRWSAGVGSSATSTYAPGSLCCGCLFEQLRDGRGGRWFEEALLE
jgi:hypothetical protein